MADASKYHVIRRIGTSSALWTPITCPIDCTQIVIQNGDASVAQAIRTDKDDGATEKTLAVGIEYTIRSGECAFLRGDTVCYVSQASSNGPCVVSFIR